MNKEKVEAWLESLGIGKGREFRLELLKRLKWPTSARKPLALVGPQGTGKSLFQRAYMLALKSASGSVTAVFWTSNHMTLPGTVDLEVVGTPDGVARCKEMIEDHTLVCSLECDLAMYLLVNL